MIYDGDPLPNQPNLNAPIKISMVIYYNYTESPVVASPGIWWPASG